MSNDWHNIVYVKVGFEGMYSSYIGNINLSL